MFDLMSGWRSVELFEVSSGQLRDIRLLFFIGSVSPNVVGISIPQRIHLLVVLVRSLPVIIENHAYGAFFTHVFLMFILLTSEPALR